MPQYRDEELRALARVWAQDDREHAEQEEEETGISYRDDYEDFHSDGVGGDGYVQLGGEDWEPDD